MPRLRGFELHSRWVPLKKALKVQILNEVALLGVMRKRVGFQDHKNENTPKFASIKYDIKQHSDAT